MLLWCVRFSSLTSVARPPDYSIPLIIPKSQRTIASCVVVWDIDTPHRGTLMMLDSLAIYEKILLLCPHVTYRLG